MHLPNGYVSIYSLNSIGNKNLISLKKDTVNIIIKNAPNVKHKYSNFFSFNLRFLSLIIELEYGILYFMSFIMVCRGF